MTVDEWLTRYRGRKQEDGIRLGQRFVNTLGLPFAWPSLFHEEDEREAEAMIREWCEQMCYTHSIPIKEKQ